MTASDRPEAAKARPGGLAGTEPVLLRVAISELYATGMDFRDVAMALFGSEQDRAGWFERRGVPDPVLARQEAIAADRARREDEGRSDLQAVSPDAEREAGQ